MTDSDSSLLIQIEFRVGNLVGLSVYPLMTIMYPAKMADAMRIPFRGEWGGVGN